jgi:hypothetical protein
LLEAPAGSFLPDGELESRVMVAVASTTESEARRIWTVNVALPSEPVLHVWTAPRETQAPVVFVKTPLFRVIMA